MPLSSPGFAASYFEFSPTSTTTRRARPRARARGVSVCAASPLAKTPRYQPVISRKSISLLNESPIKRNELLVHSRFSTVDFRARFQCTLPPFLSSSAPSLPEASPAVSTVGSRKHAGIRRWPFAPDSPSGLHLPPPRRSALLPRALVFPQRGQFYSRVVQLFSFLWFFSPAFKRRVPPSPSLSLARSLSLDFLHKRFREENIRRRRVNIQSLISEIARNRSGQCQF